MSAPLLIGGERIREEAWFRYSVRCDRKTARAIEKAADAAGLSVTAFVQRHFETILDAAPKAAVPAVAPRARHVDFAALHDVPEGAARLYFTLKAMADADGLARASRMDLAGLARLNEKSVGNYLTLLCSRDIVRRVVAVGGNGTAGCYRVLTGRERA